MIVKSESESIAVKKVILSIATAWKFNILAFDSIQEDVLVSFIFFISENPKNYYIQFFSVMHSRFIYSVK